jgi:hypothetical protein
MYKYMLLGILLTDILNILSTRQVNRIGELGANWDSTTDTASPILISPFSMSKVFPPKKIPLGLSIKISKITIKMNTEFCY